MSEASRDQNHVPTALGVSSVDSVTPTPFVVNPVTGRLLTDVSGGGSGTVTSVSVVSANGFAGTVATATTTPAITLTTTITGILKGNGTAISAASDGTDYLSSTTGLKLDQTSAQTITNDTPIFNTLTASELVATTAAKKLQSLAVATYPSLTEISYVKGVTSSLQTQLNAKQATITFGTGVETALGVNVGTAGSIVVNGGALGTPSSGTVTNLTGTASININGTVGATTPTTIVGTTIQANTGFLPDTDGGAYLGQPTQAFSNLYLDTTATVNFDNGNVVLTHSSGILTVSTGDLRVTTAGTNSASVVTVGGTQTLTAKTLTAPTLGGTATFAEGGSIAYDAASSADGVYTGFVRAGTAGTTLAFGDLVYLASADSRWELADADAATTSDRFLGMCVLAAASDGSATTILLNGFIRADAAFPTMTIGSAMYVGETAGDIQVAIPTGADNIIRRVGYAWTADELYFNPSMDAQVTVA